MELEFDWDEAKAIINLQKHGVSFDDAKTVFLDHSSITIYDQHHSDDEERFIDIGRTEQGYLLVVVYTERKGRIRIISSRRATAKEQRRYEQQNHPNH